MIGADAKNFGVEFFLTRFLFPRGKLERSARGEVKNIKEQDDVVFSLEILEAHVIPFA